MSVTVNQTKATEILKAAISSINSDYFPSTKQKNDIEQVILGTHLTYRYILTTGLISKATNPECNPLALQAGSELKGAYDARSICHNVLVPVERKLLGDRLGGSNEPFLNKPARYQDLDIKNPVRRGNDSKLLLCTINILSSLSSSDDAFNCLKDCIYYIFKRESRNLTDYLSDKVTEYQQTELIEFAALLLSKSFEGETSALLVGLTYSLFSENNTGFDVRVHKVNQAGSSSNEVLDVDVYDGEELIYTIEVKDKNFTSDDVEHAVSKAIRAGCRSVVFATGPNGTLLKNSISELTRIWAGKGIDLYFVDVLSHFVSTITYLSIDVHNFIKIINYHTDKANMKDETIKHIVSIFRQLGWMDG